MDAKNRDAYEDLLVSIEANQNKLNLLIAVCNDSQLRASIIEQYETELTEIAKYRVTLTHQDPSLKAAIDQLIQKEAFPTNTQAVITVTGLERLRLFNFEGEPSEQEKFLGYLQWTRESFMHYSYSIVLWLSTSIEDKLKTKAPDFWSWRKGVFRFISRPRDGVASSEIQSIIGLAAPNFESNSSVLLPLEDLQALIEKIETTKGKTDPSLAALYINLANVYRDRIEQGNFLDYSKEENLAIDYLQKAIELQKISDSELDLASSLNNLAGLYQSQGRYEAAEPLFLEALDLRKRLLGDNHHSVATSLNNLAELYRYQGRYEAAEPLFLEALDLKKRLLGDNHPHLATSLNNLANLYYSQGRYEAAEPLYLEALDLYKRLLGDNNPHVATSLNNLANLYYSQGRYEAAEPLYLEALDLYKRLLGDNNPNVATFLQNLANLYYSQGRYEAAEPLYLEAIAICRRVLGENHPNTKMIVNTYATMQAQRSS